MADRRRLPAVAFVFLVAASASAAVDTPDTSAWILNRGETGYAGISANVSNVRCSDANAWVNATGIPSYTIGPWPGNPNVPANQNYLFRIPRQPTPETNAHTATPLGKIGTWINGVAIFNAKDAMSFQNEHFWNQNAVVVEGPSFDACLGHPAPGGVYHHHQNPRCLHSDDASVHSPILGFAFDGFPIYGPRGFAKADGSGGIARVRSSWRKRNITERHVLPDGTVLAQSLWGPDVSSQYPLGYYLEDFEFADGSGDLDIHNGRFGVTPEYPEGTYAYFVTIDESGASAFPYAIGETYYGVVAADNITPGGGPVLNETVEDCRSAAPVPAIGFEPSPILAGRSIRLLDRSSGSPTSWTWEFGDGATSRERNPPHAWSAAGRYVVRLRVSNGAGEASAAFDVTVEQPSPDDLRRPSEEIPAS